MHFHRFAWHNGYFKTTRAQLIALKNDGGSSSCVGVSCASPSVPPEELNLSPCQVSYLLLKRTRLLKLMGSASKAS